MDTGIGKAAGRSESLADWVGLRLIPGVGSVLFARLLDAFGQPGQALGAPLGELKRIKGMPEAVARRVSGREFAADPDRELTRLEAKAATVLTLEDEQYPPLLKMVYAPPPVLFVRGSLEPCRRESVAVVGSRRTSPYGRRVAQNLGRDLGRAGVSLISGLARGIDSVAHLGALEAGGHTVGVLGCGLNVDYPPENAGLTERMAQYGAVVSEFPLGTPPLAGNFPVRNRIISGMSRAVVVVEGGKKSGSLITARHALDQGREVFAVPGPVGTPGVEGSHELIRQGARLFESAQDLLSPGSLPPLPFASERAPALPADLPLEGQKLLELLGDDPVHLDALAREAGLKSQEAVALMVNLELAGLVCARPGKFFVRS